MKSNVAVCVCIGVGLLLLSSAQRRRGGGGGGGPQFERGGQTFQGTNGVSYQAGSLNDLTPAQLADVKQQTLNKRRSF